jgi:hypothetical protein
MGLHSFTGKNAKIFAGGICFRFQSLDNVHLIWFGWISLAHGVSFDRNQGTGIRKPASISLDYFHCAPEEGNYLQPSAGWADCLQLGEGTGPAISAGTSRSLQPMRGPLPQPGKPNCLRENAIGFW